MTYNQAHTFGGFQRKEQNMIYISLVRNNEKGKTDFLEAITMTHTKKN